LAPGEREGVCAGAPTILSRSLKASLKGAATCGAEVFVGGGASATIGESAIIRRV
jgi:hypothetical protein